MSIILNVLWTGNGTDDDPYRPDIPAQYADRPYRIIGEADPTQPTVKVEIRLSRR